MADKQFRLRILTPERVFYEGMADMAIFQAVEGELGVLPGHIPLTTLISSSSFQILTEDKNKTTVVAVHEGFVEILPDQVTLLTEAAEWPEEIDVERAERARERAQKRLDSSQDGLDIKRAQLAMQRALTRLQVHTYKDV